MKNNNTKRKGKRPNNDIKIYSLGGLGVVGMNMYVVESGDTLYKIAMDNNISVTDLINLNELTTTNLSIGQVLYLP